MFNEATLLLDLDGTLLDIAPTPDSVVVEPGLVASLTALQAGLNGALAIVTGRSIETVDGLLQHRFAAAGEHGAALRRRPDAPIERPDLPSAPDSWLNEAAQLAAAWPGALMERKARGFTLHFRQVPEAGPVFQAALSRMLAEAPGFHLLAGLMVWEVRPIGADKGAAVTALMAQAPFQGRLPLFIGDDVTDEDGMRVARAMGGAGLRVDAAFGTPAGVRLWLREAAARRAWPPLPR